MSSMLNFLARRVTRSPILMSSLRQQQQKSTKLMCSAAGSSRTYNPSPLEKKFLVWTKKYKTVEEIPNLINQEVMDKAKNKIRIRLANIMMLLTALGCVAMVISGKNAAKRGETVQQQNLDWHKEYNAQQAGAVQEPTKNK